MIPVSITISILAVSVAVATLLGHRAHTEELLLQAKASDQWAYYQAKNIRLRELESFADLLDVVATQESDKAGRLRESYRNDLRETKRITDFEYVRFHAIFHDEVGLYDEDKDGNKRKK